MSPIQKSKNFSDIVAHEIDEEMRDIIRNCYENSKKILNENKDLLKLIAETLLEEETITKEQIDYLVEHKELPDETSLNDLTVDELREKAKEAGIKGYTKMTKEELEEATRD